MIGRLPSLLGVKKMSKEESSRRSIFTLEQLGVVAGSLVLSFSFKFLSIFVYISGSKEPITVS